MTRILFAILPLVLWMNISVAQTSATATQLNNSNYDRIMGAAISEILPPPSGADTMYAKVKAKVEEKLQGEANEELLVSLMAIGVTYTPSSSNELASIISSGNSYLNGEKGAADASGIFADGLDALFLDIQQLDTDEKSIQLETLKKHKQSVSILKAAIGDKLSRYAAYDINQSQSTTVISNEGTYFNKCEQGSVSGPSQGLLNFIPKLSDLELGNQTSIASLTASIESNLNDVGLPVTSSVADIDIKLADPATTPDEITKLNQVKSDKDDKEKLIVENSWIATCKTEINPYPSTLSAIKAEENNYINQTLDSMNDISGEIALPVMGSAYQNFNLTGSCSSPPPGFPLAAYVGRMKSDCATWINYYKSPYMIPPVATNATTAKNDERYKVLSNCEKVGRTCDYSQFDRISNELKSIAMFPIGRLIVTEMIKQSIAKSILFYDAILGNPSYVDCEITEATDALKLICYDNQRNSPGCLTGIGIDCERAELGYLIYRFKHESEKANVELATDQGQEEQEELAEGFVDIDGIAEPPPVPPVDLSSSSSPPSVTKIDGMVSTPDAGISTKLQKEKQVNGGQFLKPDPKSVSIGAKARASNVFSESKTLRKYIEKSYLKNSKLKSVKKNRQKSGHAKNVLAKLSSNALEKLANSYTAKEMLFTSYVPKGGSAEELKTGNNKYKKKQDSFLSNNSGALGGKVKSLMGGGALGKKGKGKEKVKTEARETDEKTKVSAAKKEESEPLFNTISARYQKSLGRLGLSEDPLGGSIHAKKRNLFDIVSARYRKTEIYHDHSHRP